MKRVLLVMLAGCLMLAACKKETEIERDQLHNTVWQSGQYNENSGGAIAYGAIYYNDGDACRELLKFSYGFVDRYYTYHGEEIKYLPGGQYEIVENTFTIPNDTLRVYKIEENHIVSYFNDGRKDGTFHRIN